MLTLQESACALLYCPSAGCITVCRKGWFVRLAYFHFIHAFVTGRWSYAPELFAKRTVRRMKKCHRHQRTSCNHVMQLCCLAYCLLGGLRQHLSEYNYLRSETIKTCSEIIIWNAKWKK